jgi:hypothetical protein
MAIVTRNIMDSYVDKASDVARAHSLLMELPPEVREELCDILRRWIAGRSPEQADTALVELFHEIQVCDEVLMERCGYKCWVTCNTKRNTGR